MRGNRPAILLELTLLGTLASASAYAAVVNPSAEDQEKAVYEQAVIQRTSMERAGKALQQDQERVTAAREAEIMALRGDPNARAVVDDPIVEGEPDPNISRPYGVVDYALAAGLVAVVVGLVLIIVRSNKAYTEMNKKKLEVQAASAQKRSSELAAINAALDQRVGK